jgi:amidase
MKNALGAFCDDRPVHIEGLSGGVLSGLDFGAKDVFDIAGFPNSAGNPDWLRTHPPAIATASAVQRLIEAGATLSGKTHTDELTYSLNGENHHYGTPVNANAPGRIPGGSSSGSASAVAGGLTAFALGTDTGGSVRLPASNCGIYGFRPTHGRVSNDGVVPLAPSFDTVGWFARDAATLARVGEVLLDEEAGNVGPLSLLLAADAFGLVFEEMRPALESAADIVGATLGVPRKVNLYGGASEEWMMAFRVIQGAEVWSCHGAWILRHAPEFGPGIRERFEWAASIDPEIIPPARAVREQVRHRLDDLLEPGAVLCVPTSPSIALHMNAGAVKQERFRSQALSLLFPWASP